jgi:hypothetical protein
MLGSGIALWVVGGKRLPPAIRGFNVGVVPLKGGGSAGASFAF